MAEEKKKKEPVEKEAAEKKEPAKAKKEKAKPEAEKAAKKEETAPEGVEASPSKSSKKINKMTLEEVEAKLEDVKTTQGGLSSKYAQQLLRRKGYLSSIK